MLEVGKDSYEWKASRIQIEAEISSGTISFQSVPDCSSISSDLPSGVRDTINYCGLGQGESIKKEEYSSTKLFIISCLKSLIPFCAIIFCFATIATIVLILVAFGLTGIFSVASNRETPGRVSQFVNWTSQSFNTSLDNFYL